MKEIISRQLKWQKKMIKEGRCIICGKPAIPNGKHCVRCWLNQHIKYAKKRTLQILKIQEMLECCNYL